MKNLGCLQEASLKGVLAHNSTKKFLPTAIPEDWAVRKEISCFDPKLQFGCFSGFCFGWVPPPLFLDFIFRVFKRKSKFQLRKFVKQFISRNSNSRALG